MSSKPRHGRPLPASRGARLQYTLTLVWLVFTVSLAVWWLVFGLRQADQIRRLDHAAAPRLERVQRMLLWEGGVLVAALFAGGAALLYETKQEKNRRQAFEEFYAAFTHDLKTSLASLQLQLESLQEDLSWASGNPLLTRLQKDSVRLQLQLENSLFFAHLRKGELLVEALPLSRVIELVRHDFPELKIGLQVDGKVLADAHVIESVVRNLFQNALVHGGADTMEISLERSGPRVSRILFKDNGRGMHEDRRRLGELFFRPAATSGAGVGLYIGRQLLRRMGGDLQFPAHAEFGFVAAIDLPEARA